MRSDLRLVCADAELSRMMTAATTWATHHPWIFPVLLVVVNLIFFYGGKAIARSHRDIREHPEWKKVLEMAESYAKAGDEEAEPTRGAPTARGSAKIERLALPARATAMTCYPLVVPADGGSGELVSDSDARSSGIQAPSTEVRTHRIAAAAVIASLALTFIHFVSGGRTRSR